MRFPTRHTNIICRGDSQLHLSFICSITNLARNPVNLKKRQKIIREAEEAGRAEQRREAARQKMRERQMRKGISADYLEDNDDDGYSLNAIKVLVFRCFLARIQTEHIKSIYS